MRILRDENGENPIMVSDDGKAYANLAARHGDGLHAFLLARQEAQERADRARRIEKAPAHKGPRLRVAE